MWLSGKTLVKHTQGQIQSSALKRLWTNTTQQLPQPQWCFRASSARADLGRVRPWQQENTGAALVACGCHLEDEQQLVSEDQQGSGDARASRWSSAQSSVLHWVFLWFSSVLDARTPESVDVTTFLGYLLVCIRVELIIWLLFYFPSLLGLQLESVICGVILEDQQHLHPFCKHKAWSADSI